MGARQEGTRALQQQGREQRPRLLRRRDRLAETARGRLGSEHVDGSPRSACQVRQQIRRYRPDGGRRADVRLVRGITMQQDRPGPVPLSEEQVAAASEGRSAEVLGAQEPVEMSEDEVRAASEGRSEEVFGSKGSGGSAS